MSNNEILAEMLKLFKEARKKANEAEEEILKDILPFAFEVAKINRIAGGGTGYRFPISGENYIFTLDCYDINDGRGATSFYRITAEYTRDQESDSITFSADDLLNRDAYLQKRKELAEEIKGRKAANEKERKRKEYEALKREFEG